MLLFIIQTPGWHIIVSRVTEENLFFFFLRVLSVGVKLFLEFQDHRSFVAKRNEKLICSFELMVAWPSKKCGGKETKKKTVSNSKVSINSTAKWAIFFAFYSGCWKVLFSAQSRHISLGSLNWSDRGETDKLLTLDRSYYEFQWLFFCSSWPRVERRVPVKFHEQQLRYKQKKAESAMIFINYIIWIV